jgi:hypothetical protein
LGNQTAYIRTGITKPSVYWLANRTAC